MSNTTLKAQIDSQITNKTTPSSVTPTLVGSNMKDIVNLNKLKYKAKLSQDGSSNITATVLQDEFVSPFEITYTRNSTGSYQVAFGGNITPLSGMDIIVNLQNASYLMSNVAIDNLGILATIETRYWNGTTFVLSDGILQNATIYIYIE